MSPPPANLGRESKAIARNARPPFFALLVTGRQ